MTSTPASSPAKVAAPGKPRGWPVPVGTALALLCVMGLSVFIGPSGIGPGAVLAGVLHPATLNGVIVWQIRMPRIALGALVGIALATAGVIFQTLFRNPLTDPYVVGSASGAAFGATLALVVLPATLLPWSLSVGAFIGALLAVAAAVAIAARTRYQAMVNLLLIGYAISVILGAAIALLLTVDRQDLASVFFWELGSLSSASWQTVWITLPLVAVGSFVPLALRSDLNALLLGEDEARSVGVDVPRVRLLLIAAASLLTAAAVAAAGIIGFVGLVAPHAIRRLSGESHHRILPTAALGGGAFLVVADAVARSIPGLGEIPIGIVTALVGGPLFVYLLTRRPGGEPN